MRTNEIAPPATESREIQADVRRFYDSIGWKQIGPGLYQNARFEDLRPVSEEYIRRCRLRVGRHLPGTGNYLLDAGSGPIQYPEYLEYSRGFRYRVCLDLSRRALLEARARLGGHGLFVVGDLARLPFRDGVFEGIASLHAVHHLPPEQQGPSFTESARVLHSGGRAVIVYSWGERAPLARLLAGPVAAALALSRLYRRLRRKESGSVRAPRSEPKVVGELSTERKTHIHQHGYSWMVRALDGLPPHRILVWRSLGTAVLRALIHDRLGGRGWLRVLYGLEERAPRVFGWLGQHPMIVVSKPGAGASGGRD